MTKRADRPGAARCGHCRVVTVYADMVRAPVGGGTVRWLCKECFNRLERLGLVR